MFSYVRSTLCTYGIVADVVVVVVECSLYDLGGLLDEVQELWCREYAELLLLRHF